MFLTLAHCLPERVRKERQEICPVLYNVQYYIYIYHYKAVNIYFFKCSFEDAVEILLKHGARVDVEARMCWPGPHQQNCEERVKHSRKNAAHIYSSSSDKLQCAIYYAIGGDQVIRDLLLVSEKH